MTSYLNKMEGSLFEKKVRVLFISHDAGRYGAPLSLYLLMKEFSKHTKWEFKLIIRTDNGTLLPDFKKICPTFLFYKKKYALKDLITINMEFNSNTPQDVIKTIYHEQVVNQVQEWNPDFIYSNTAMNGDIINHFDHNKPVIVHVRELEWFLSTLDKLRLNTFIKRTNLFFAVSQAVKNNLIERHGVDGERIKIVPAAVLSNYIIKKANFLASLIKRIQFKIPKNKIIIGAVGRIDKRKGNDYFFDVAKKIIQQKDNVFFLWVGSGPDEEELLDKINKNKYKKYFLITGMQNNQYPIMNNIDILLMTSRDDPFPRVNMEIGALGKPVVAFGDSGGSSEYIGEDSGYVVNNFNVKEMADKTIQLINDAQLRKQFGENARNKVLNHYDVRVVAQQAFNFINDYIEI